MKSIRRQYTDNDDNQIMRVTILTLDGQLKSENVTFKTDENKSTIIIIIKLIAL